MENYKSILIEKSGGIATIWLNRPELQNAVSVEMLDELIHSFLSFSTDNEIRVVVLRGKGKSFSAGADLNRMLESNALSFKENLEDGMKWANCLSTIYNAPMPVIAIATGNVFGGGNGLLSASDIVIADDNAVFSFSEVKLGIAPSTILPYTLTRLNEHKAKYLMFTGRRIDAKEALALGLIDFAVSSENIETILESILNDIIKSSPGGVAEVKSLIRNLRTVTDFDEIANITASSIANLKISDEAKEGISAFLEKRKPSWYPQ